MGKREHITIAVVVERFPRGLRRTIDTLGILLVAVSPVLFGVILVSGLAVGACTPPVGNCLNVCSLVSGLRIGTIFRAAIPFLAANVIVLVLITLFPQLVLWIPRVLMD